MKKFTDKQKLKLEYELKRFEPKQVEKFIHNAEILLEPASHVATKQGDSKGYHLEMDDLVKQVDDLREKTKKLERGMISGVVIFRNETMKGFESLAPEKWNRLLAPDPYHARTEEIQVLKDAWEATNALEKLSNSLKTVRKKNTHSLGRKPADHYGICLNLGYFYFKAFNKMPSITKGGPFIEVLKIFLQALNLPCSDPTRLIKSSLPELKKGLEIERKHDEELKNR